jgi:uncharacterized membrane protein YeiH
MAARGKRIDLFGVLVLALATAFGGGTLRDLALGSVPVFWVSNPDYLLTAAGAAVVWFFVAQKLDFPRQGLLVADAGALALFTVAGAQKSLAFGAAPSIAITMGVITGVVGGIIRDVLIGEIPLVFRREINFYATAAFSGAVAYVALHEWAPAIRLFSAPIGVGIILVVRLASIRWKLALPEYKHPPGRDA